MRLPPKGTVRRERDAIHRRTLLRLLVTLLSTMLTANVLVPLYRYLMRLIWGG